jgi:DNA-binding PadR family transcriptional regulator
VIELAVLGSLQDQDLHGYELRKRISELAGGRSSVSFGSLYPALARLEAAGAVKAVEAAESPRARLIPLTGSLSGEASAFLARRRATSRRGRGRKVYGLTETGRNLLVEALEDPDTDERLFPLKVAFCGALSGDQRLALFQRRRDHLAAQLADQQARRERNGAPRLDRYRRALRERDTNALGNDLAWLDGLIAAERADAPTQEDQTP